MTVNQIFDKQKPKTFAIGSISRKGNNIMTSRERVFRQIRGEIIDRPPLMGGWLQSAENLAALAGLSLEDYFVDLKASLIMANRALAVDCVLTNPILPAEINQARQGHILQVTHADVSPEKIKEDAEALPDSEAEILKSLDVAEIKNHLCLSLTEWIQIMGDIVPIINDWGATPNFQGFYEQYGYEAYLMAIALYPESVGRLYWHSAVVAKKRNEILVSLIRELELPPMIFTGQDICNNRGPMCSMDFLRQYYFPQESFALAPLVDAGIRVVRHCDGNIMPMLDDCIRVGYSGFQGFQYECGINPFAIAKRRSIRDERLLFFAGLNVTRTLPFGTIDDIREEIEYVLDYTDGGKGLFFFTSSSIGPEVPLENIKYAYNYMANRKYSLPESPPTSRPWPWLTKHGSRVTEQ